MVIKSHGETVYTFMEFILVMINICIYLGIE